MARTDTLRRRPAATGRQRRGQRARRWRRGVIALAGFVILFSAALALFAPSPLQRLLAPAGEVLRPLLPLLTLWSLWALAFYVAARRNLSHTLRRWHRWVGSFLALAAVAVALHAVGGLSFSVLPIESLADLATAAATVMAAGLVGAFLLILLAASFSFPRHAWRLLKSGGRLAGRGLAWQGRALLRLLARRLRRRRTAQSPTDAALALTPEPPRPRARSAAAVDQPADTLPRIILPAQALGERAEDLVPEDGARSGLDEDAATDWDHVPTVGDPGDPFGSLPAVRWRFPPLEMLAAEPVQQIDHEAHLRTAEAIENTLDEYAIEAQVTEVRPGPTVTLYGLRPGWIRRYKEVRERDAMGATTTRREEIGKVRIKVDRIAALDRDLAMQLRTSSIRIEAPIPGTNLIGIEVPNADPQLVLLRSLLHSEAFRRLVGRTRLAIPLGKGSGGEALVADLARMPHLLIAGATGSGKSVFINTAIVSLISHASPRDLRLLLVDPKRVELTVYNGIPHLIEPVVVDTSKVVNGLRWLTLQMEERLQVLAEAGARDIASYNRKRDESQRMPYLVLIIDELADLMISTGKAVEQGLVRLAQMGRATGIHLVVATQRPSVDVVTGLIKANFPTRISFMVTAFVDSRTILDTGGAEKLLGRGDMLYLPQDAARPVRIQGAFVSEEETQIIAAYWRAQAGGYRPPELPELLAPEELTVRAGGRNAFIEDDVLQRARELAELQGGRISTSFLQRRLGIGYPRAARLRDLLVEEGLASPDLSSVPAESRARRQASRDLDP